MLAQRPAKEGTEILEPRWLEETDVLISSNRKKKLRATTENASADSELSFGGWKNKAVAS